MEVVYEAHPIANIFPMIQDKDIEVLAQDIKAHGLRNVAYVYEDKLLDGRNRQKACKIAKVEFRTKEFKGSFDEALAFVLSENLHRRHLTEDQRASVAGGVVHLFAAEAKKRQKSGKGPDGSGGRGKKKNLTPNSAEGFKPPRSPEATEQAASLLGVKKGRVKNYLKVQKANKKLAEQVAAGKVKLGKAVKQVKRDAVTAAVAPKLPEGKFDLILADPPWKYDFAETENREIENHYPTMCVEELSKLEPPAAKDCVLFMWATAPKLREALQLMEAWGFDYKTHAIWDKQKIGMGYWFRGQHELLLVGTKGKASPPDEKLRVPSVFSFKRGNHSAKPVEVYGMIESMLPNATRCEMFAREEHKGWTAWGNQL